MPQILKEGCEMGQGLGVYAYVYDMWLMVHAQPTSALVHRFIDSQVNVRYLIQNVISEFHW